MQRNRQKDGKEEEEERRQRSSSSFPLRCFRIPARSSSGRPGIPSMPCSSDISPGYIRGGEEEKTGGGEGEGGRREEEEKG